MLVTNDRALGIEVGHPVDVDIMERFLESYRFRPPDVSLHRGRRVNARLT
jgi:hypothetical protein